MLQVPKTKLPEPSPPPTPGVRTAEAYLESYELQDLAEHIGEVTKLAAGLDLKIRVSIELGGAPKSSDAAVSKINEILKQISDQFQIE